MVASTQDLQDEIVVGQAFKPKPEHLALMPLFSKGIVPRYLFRVCSTKTAGETNEGFVSSPACCAQIPHVDDLRQDIFALDAERAADLLDKHFWWKQGHEANCNLMSWTSSLLFALLHGLFRHRDDFDSPKLDDIKLLVLDTKELSPAFFVKDLELLNVFSSRNLNLQKLEVWRTTESYYFSEYLSQGCLRTQEHCTQVSLLQMQLLGLFNLLPSLEVQKWETRARKVVEYRATDLRQHSSTTRAEVRRAITLAQAVFGDPWVIPISLMILALKSRVENDGIIGQAFKAMFSKEEISKALDSLQLDTLQLDPERLPELTQFDSLVKTITSNKPLDIEHVLEQLSIN